MDTIEINGRRYIAADTMPEPQTMPDHPREVLIIDRGWVVGGDVDAESMPGHIVIWRAATLRHWEGGLAECVAGRGSMTLEHHERPVYVPLHSVIMRLPAAPDWGIHG